MPPAADEQAVAALERLILRVAMLHGTKIIAHDWARDLLREAGDDPAVSRAVAAALGEREIDVERAARAHHAIAGLHTVTAPDGSIEAVPEYGCDLSWERGWAIRFAREYAALATPPAAEEVRG